MLQTNHFWHFATWEIGHMSQHVTGDLVAENYPAACNSLPITYLCKSDIIDMSVR
jgi:hypothetical protein